MVITEYPYLSISYHLYLAPIIHINMLGRLVTWACIGERLVKLVTVSLLTRFSRVRLFETLWTVARQAPLSMGFPRQEYWSGLPCPPPGDLPYPGMKLRVLHLLHLYP